MASIKEIKTVNGVRFDVRWRLPNGRDRQKRFVTKRQAQAWFKQVTAAPVDTKAGRTTFEVVAKDALSAKSLKPSTLAGYERIVRDRLLPTFGGMKIDKIDRRAIVAWQKALPTDVAASTTRSWVVTLSKVMRYAMRAQLITSNPMDGLTPPTPLNTFGARFLTATEVDKLATTLAGMDAWPSDVLVKFAAWSGLRAGELTALTVGDLNLRRGVVSVTKTARKPTKEWEVTTPKSLRSNREVPLAPHVVSMLREYLALRPDKGVDGSAPLWPGRVNGGAHHGDLDWNKRHEHTSFYRWHFRRAVEASGLAPLRFHDLRHTYASLCAEAGVPMHKVSRWLGHASVSTTDLIYTHLFTDHSAELAKLTALAGG